MPAELGVPTYGDDFSVRWVQSNGTLQWKGTRLMIGHMLCSQPVGLRQIDDGEWEVHFGARLLGYVLMRNGIPALERLS